MRFALLLSIASGLTAAECQVGLTSSQKPIACDYGPGALDYGAAKRRLVLIGGLDGSKESADAVRAMQTWFTSSPYQKKFALATVPLANPDAATLKFPPTGDAYKNQTESHYLWRWLIVLAADHVLIAGPDPAGLAAALPAATRLDGQPGALKQFLETRGASVTVSAEHQEMSRRLARKPQEVAAQLAKVYGHELPEAVYIPAVALMARIRMGDVADVERIVEPYLTGAKDSLAKASGSHLSGHLVFAELYRKTSKPGYLQLVRKAADMGFTASGQMQESMPLHSEMSDSVFMGTPILAAAGALTREPKYFDMAVRHFEFMKKLDLRSDGIYRHSPLDEAAWGRGNGFPALGLALTLSDFPATHPGQPMLLAEFRKHMQALAKHQEMTGMWREVIDLPGSYRELTATCMIAFAMHRGIHRGWLDRKTFQPLVDRAWAAVKLRAASNGGLIDVCTSTGKQKSLRDYLERTAILGPDPRGGAMVLLLATELSR